MKPMPLLDQSVARHVFLFKSNLSTPSVTASMIICLAISNFSCKMGDQQYGVSDFNKCRNGSMCLVMRTK